MGELTVEEIVTEMRRALKSLEMSARAIAKEPDDRLNKDAMLRGEQRAQSMLAVRAIEDARMRLGKVIQYGGDGVSVYDK